MYVIRKGNLFEASEQAIVNPVNCVGIDGKGLALAFKKRYPANSVAYREACKQGSLHIGKVHVFDNGSDASGTRYIVNFPTKDHWRNPSKLEYIDKGLCALHTALKDRHISSVGLPMLGAGLGGLNPDTVLWKIVGEFQDDPDISATIYLM